ncbi:Mov34/MPN/PAD-1 family protein [Corallococcus sp. NCSPR001]|uniref:Mov34/MPN/PAD-1 family protein n=1 Tax=Corallococcus sp. NCRR TaxID=2996782 RepID=UPI001A8DB679|nr:Mov34/MPN/PAD-1 family protein [Corallococcus sp. NCSPR001]
MKGLLFRRAGGGVLKVSPEVLARLDPFRQLEPSQTEAGGVLLGRQIQGCDDIIIDEVTTPMTGDSRARLRFHRAPSRHQSVIDARWAESQGTCHYLGEWHTHPEPVPTPSSVDVDGWRRRLKEDRFEGSSLFFLIVGMEQVAIWEGIRMPRHLVPLQLQQSS